MIREFTNAKLKELKSYVEARDDMNWFQQKIESLGDTPKRLGKAYYDVVKFFAGDNYIDGNKERSKRYYSYLVDVKNYSVAQLNVMFDLANDKDKTKAIDFSYLISSAENLIKEIKALTDIATPEYFQSNSYLSGTGDHINGGEIVIIAEEPGISDEKLIELCEKGDNSDYLKAVVNVDDAICEMDFTTAVWISIFNHKDILIADIMNTPGAPDAKKYVYDQILNGGDGFCTFDDVIDQLTKKGLIDPNNKSDVEYIRKLLIDRSKGNYANLGSLPPERRDSFNVNQNRNELIIKTELDAILARELQNMINNPDAFAKYCESIGRDTEFIKLLYEGDINGYSVSLYKDALAKSLEEICDEQSYTIDLGGTEDVVSVVMKSNKLWSLTTEDGKTLKNMLKNGVFSDAESKKMLEMLGIKDASISQIKSFRTIVENWESFKGIYGKLKYVNQGLEKIAYWVADYQGEIDMLDGLIESAKLSGDKEYLVALESLRDTYSDKFFGTLGKITEELLEEGYDKAMEGLSNLAFGEPLLTVAEVAISITGKVTGASGHFSAAQEMLAYVTICPNCIQNYENAVNLVASGDTSEAALLNVRSSFTIMKQTLTDYYKAQLDYAKGTVFSAKDSRYIAYLEYEMAKLEDMKLGTNFEAISFDQFKLQFCGNN